MGLENFWFHLNRNYVWLYVKNGWKSIYCLTYLRSITRHGYDHDRFSVCATERNRFIFTESIYKLYTKLIIQNQNVLYVKKKSITEQWSKLPCLESFWFYYNIFAFQLWLEKPPLINIYLLDVIRLKISNFFNKLKFIYFFLTFSSQKEKMHFKTYA